MSRCRRRKPRGGTLVLKKKDEALCQRVRELGGDKVGVVPIDVSKLRVAAMVTDFYGNVLSAPEEFPVTADGLLRLDRRIQEKQKACGLKLMVIGLEQTGRLHEPVRRVLQSHWEIKMIHPLVTSHLRQGISRDIKTEGMDLDAQARAVIGCYGTPLRPLPVAYERWRALHRAREQLVDERAALKLHMHERLHAVLPCFARQFDNLWASPAALALIRELDSPAALLKYSEQGLRQRLHEQGVRCTRGKAEALLAWAADAVSPAASASTEAAILRADLDHLAFLGHRLETCEIELLRFLVQTPFVLLLSVAGIGHVLASGLGAAAGPMEFYPTARNLSGRAGLYARRYQSDETDLQGCRMARGEPFLRDVLMKCGHCLIMAGGAFFSWGQKRRNDDWSEKEITAAMANRFCRIAHILILSGQTFRHPDAKPGVSVLGKLLNVAADLGLDSAQSTELALQATARIPPHARQIEIVELQTGAWKQDNRPREHGASPCSTVQISRDTVPVLLTSLRQPEENQHTSLTPESRSP